MQQHLPRDGGVTGERATATERKEAGTERDTEIETDSQTKTKI